MRALIAEYTIISDPSLAPEGQAMFDVLTQSFSRCGYEVVSPREGDFTKEIERLAPSCDVGLVIAPDHLLASFTRCLEAHTHNVGCGSMNAAICANKRQTGSILASHGIAVPAEQAEGLRVIKPIRGCGSLGVRLSTGPVGDDEFGQELIEGEHISVSLVGGRVAGDVCEFYSGAPPLLLAVNRQDIRRSADGRFHYYGGETPVYHPRQEEIVGTASRAVTVLGCQGYTGVDCIVSDRVYVIDVNPRPTTSLTGICACMSEEIADILVKASRGEVPGRVTLTGRVRFDAQGQVTAV